MDQANIGRTIVIKGEVTGGALFIDDASKAKLLS